MKSTAVSGFVAPGFEPVAEAFEANFRERGDVGGAFAAVQDGELVVDLWGGLADSKAGRRWERDTAVVVFSGTKGVVALCLLLLADRGALDLDAPVTDYWPEFGAHGKGDVRVLELASHQARLPAVPGGLAEADLLDGRRLAGLLAEQPQVLDPRVDPYAYHGITYGWLCGELIRRVDGRTAGRFFAEEVAEPLGLDVWIGIDPKIEGRVATLQYGLGMEELARSLCGQEVDPLQEAIFAHGLAFPVDQRKLPWNRPEFHQAEIPGAGGIATARGLARMYGAVVAADSPLISPGLVERARQRIAGGDPFDDGVIHSFGIGFQVQDEESPPSLGPPLEAFGHPGAGGSVHGAWPRHRVGFSYAMNELREEDPPGPRTEPLLSALYAATTAR